MPASDRAVLTFRIADRRFALDSALVAEVMRWPNVTRVPKSPGSLLGVASVRGEVAPVVSLGRLLGIGGNDDDQSKLILLEGEDAIGLAVDEVTGLQASDADGGLIMTGDGDARIVALPELLQAEFAMFQGSGRRAIAAAPKPASEAAKSAELAFLGFQLAGQSYCLPLEDVRQVIAAPKGIASLPRADEAALGVVRLGDGLLPIVSARVLLGLPPASLTSDARIIVASLGGARLGLAVDRLTSILRAPATALAATPKVLNRGEGEAQIAAMLRTGQDGLVSVLAAERLFREERVAAIVREERGEAEDMQAASETIEAGERLLIFTLGEEWYGLPIAAVEEVANLPATLARLPKAPPFVLGMMNLRGAPVPVIDQRRRFDVGEAGGASRRRVIVTRLDETVVGFAVDAVTQIVEVPAGRLRPTPGLAADASRLFDRVVRLDGDDRVILLVNPRELLSRAEADLLASLAEGEGAS